MVIDGAEVKRQIRTRLAKINRRRRRGDRLTIARLCEEAGLSIETYRSLSRPNRNYLLSTVQSFDAALKKHELRA